MTDYDIDMGKRAVACKHWKWMPGMQATYTLGGGLEDPAESLGRLVWEKHGSEGDWNAGRWYMFPSVGTRVAIPKVPNLTDPATVGCLLALVREAWGDPHLSCVGYWRSGWRVTGGKPHGGTFRYFAQDYHPSAEAALVAALESAS